MHLLNFKTLLHLIVNFTSFPAECFFYFLILISFFFGGVGGCGEGGGK